jgi:hypothetical protein
VSLKDQCYALFLLLKVPTIRKKLEKFWNLSEDELKPVKGIEKVLNSVISQIKVGKGLVNYYFV